MSTPPVILVVDDEPNGFTVVQALLYREGYNLIYAASGTQALELLETTEPNTILLDVMMPNMDGIEVCQRIRANPDLKHLPIVMVTALNSKEDLARSIEAGADDFISKPVNGVELRARVRSMLRIKQQYDSLKAITQLREDMSNMVVHDMRNPVAAILLSCQLLTTQEKFQDKYAERLQMIESCARRLDSMINDILLLAKLEAGKLFLNPTEVDLSTLVTTVLANLQETANLKHLNLSSQLPTSSRAITADVNLLHRLIDNLLSNAIKFSPRGSQITLQVEYPQHVPENYPIRAKIQVIDQGPGVREELRQQIFEKYEVGDPLSGVLQLGLGLTFCKLVAEAHGGRIYVEDNQPKGSIFTVEL